MKKTIKLALVAALALGATSAFATNGSNLIGMGAKARGMGGVGIGMSHGAESTLANPALITSVENTEISFGGTIFMPKVTNTNDATGTGSESADSDADMNVIPSVSIASKVNDNFYFGIGMWGTAGMGVDYRDSVQNNAQLGNGLGDQYQMVTNLQLMQFGVPLAYTTNNFSIAITPLLQYGSLDINYRYGDGTGPTPGNVGTGVGQDLQFGYNLGVSYEIADFTVGAMYKSQIDMKYNKVLSSAIQNFGIPTYTNDELSTPAEIGIGVSYKLNEHTIAVDYKQIKWSSAKGYEDFEWDDQNVIAVGYEYKTSYWAARAGFNYAESPIEDQTFTGTNSAGLDQGTVDTFNLLGFPAVVQTHITVGGTYNVSKTTSIDVAYAYAPEVEETFATSPGTNISVKHSQTSLSLGLNYAF